MTPRTKAAQINLAWQQHTQPKLRDKLLPKLRNRLAEAQNWRCCYCGVRMEGECNAPNAPTFEHIQPLACQGKNLVENLVIACYRCNQRRGRNVTLIHLAALGKL